MHFLKLSQNLILLKTMYDAFNPEILVQMRKYELKALEL